MDSTISITNEELLCPGRRLDCDIFSEDGLLLLAAGSVVTTQDVELLHRRSWHARQRVAVQPKSPLQSSPASALSRRLDLMLSDPSICVIRPSVASVPPRRILSLSDFKAELHAGRQERLTAVNAFSQIAADMKSGMASTAEAIQQLVGGFVSKLSLDSTLLPSLCELKGQQGDYLFEHSVNVALLAIAAGEMLGFGEKQLLELGLGTILKDVGMLLVPPDIRLARRPLESSEWREVRRHPAYTLDLLENLGGISPHVMFVGYQSHERGDGTGYPNRRNMMFVHIFARIAAVADAYAAMTSERPHRPAITPYQAMTMLLRQGAEGKFDRIVIRAFLDCMSLFPIGSHVMLSNGHLARVIRANPGMHTKPVIVLIGPDGSEQDRPINLARTTDLRIVEAYGLRPPGR